MLDAGALIQKHQGKSVLVDANLLVLFLVGRVNKRRIQEFKRTQSFTIADYELLTRLIERLGKVVTTPHVLSQVSDLTDLPGKELHLIRSRFKWLIGKIDEVHDPSSTLVTDPVFARHGLTDAAIATVCFRGTLVLTADLQLQLALEHRGADALNFNHIRLLGQ